MIYRLVNPLLSSKQQDWVLVWSCICILALSNIAPALTIIAEHSFFLWDQNPLEDCVAMAVDLYMRSPHHNVVITCVDEAFRENQMDSGDFTQVQRSKAFGQKFIQIALDNQLRMLNL